MLVLSLFFFFFFFFFNSVCLYFSSKYSDTNTQTLVKGKRKSLVKDLCPCPEPYLPESESNSEESVSSSDDNKSSTDKPVLPSDPLPMSPVFMIAKINYQADPFLHRTSTCWKQSPPGSTFCDHEIRKGCSEMGPSGPNLPDAKHSQCLICSVMAAICNSVTAHGWNKPFKDHQ